MLKPVGRNGSKLADEREDRQVGGTRFAAAKKIAVRQALLQWSEEMLQRLLSVVVPVSVSVALRVFVSIKMMFEDPVVVGKPFKILRSLSRCPPMLGGRTLQCITHDVPALFQNLITRQKHHRDGALR